MTIATCASACCALSPFITRTSTLVRGIHSIRPYSMVTLLRMQYVCVNIKVGLHLVPN